MNCPVCKTKTLSEHEIESGLKSFECSLCLGHWVKSIQYWKWKAQIGASIPELSANDEIALVFKETIAPKLCPECGAFLVPYAVGHDLPFSVDRCGNCGGMWFDTNEWEALRTRGLHDDAHLIFSQFWQSQVSQLARATSREAYLAQKLGSGDLAEVKRIRTWIDNHRNKHMLLAYLLQNPCTRSDR